MLGKLIKYELRATRRTMLPLYAALLVIALLTRLSMSSLFVQNGMAHHGLLNFIAVALGTAFGLLTFAVGFITLFLMAQRFQKNLLGDEGYISFTLPVTASQNIAAKLIVSIVWFFSSFVVEILATIILTAQMRFLPHFFSSLFDFFKTFPEGYAPHAVLWTVEGVLLVLSGMSLCILMVYASIALGHCFQKHRILMSLAAFLVLLMASQLIGHLLAYLLSQLPIEALEPVASIHAGMFSLLFCCLLYCGIYFLITKYTLTHHLNLE